MKKILAVIFGLTILCWATIGSSMAASPESDRYGGIYKEVLRVGPATPIGYPPESAPDALALGAVAIESLVRSIKGGSVEPVLATSWEIAPDKKSITFHLRKNVKFHDGSTFDAKAVKWNFDKIIAAKKIRGLSSVDVIDDYTVRVNIPKYENIVLTSFSSAYIISPSAVKNKGLEWVRWHPVGTGPFMFVEYERDARLAFKRNPNYWDKGLPYLDGIEFTVVADPIIQKMAFLRGDIHSLLAQGLVAQELKNSGKKYVSQPAGTMLLIPDSRNADSPFHDRRVRMAVSHAINREALAAALGYGFGEPAYQIYPGFREAVVKNLKKQEYNPEKAKKLLAEAGYPKGFKTTIHTFVRQVPQDFIKAIANMLGEVGIRTTPDFPEGGKYTEYRFKGWKNGMMAHAFANMDNLNSGISFYFGGIQFPSVEKPEKWDAYFHASLDTNYVDPGKLQALISYMNDEAMVIPYYQEVVARFYREGVHLFDTEKYRINFPVYTEIWLESKLR